MRLIDADALVLDVMDASNADEALAMIDDAPTIDAVPVVRCRECKHNLCPDKPNSVCGLDMPIFDICGYCSEGERKEDGDGDG